MKTEILDANNPEHIELCAGVIRGGGLVAFPTETVYGLGANALCESAVAKIFSVKGRQEDNPLIVHVASPGDVVPLVADIPDAFKLLAEAFWPGPLTMVMRKNDSVPDNVTAGLDTVAVRMPDHPAALAFIRACAVPVAAPSANPSGMVSPTRAIHVKNDLDGKILYILDGGNCRVGLESTVLDISCDIPRILRPGGVTYNDLNSVLEVAGVEKSITSGTPRSPGMKYRHYATKAPVTAVLGPPDRTAEYIKSHMSDNTAALMFDDFAFDHPRVITFGSSSDYATQAACLFGALRRLDALDISAIFVQTPAENGLGQAVSNRIKKAAGSSVIDLDLP